MNRSDITRNLAEYFKLTPRDARLIVDSMFSNILRSLASGEKVILRGFGTFSVKEFKPRRSRNPQTGEEIHVEKRKTIVFKTGRHLHQRLNKS